MKSLVELEAMQETLMAQNFGARMQLLEARDRRLGAEREMEMARSKEIELRSELSTREAEKVAFMRSWRQKTMEELLNTARDRDGIKEQLQKADKRRQLVSLVSPVDAVVLDMAKLSEGSVVQGAEQMFTLVPLGAELEAEVRIDSMDIGYIKTSDSTHLKLDAFPFQKHGALEGHIRTISEDAFRRDATGNSGGLDAYYLSRISFKGSALRNMNEKMRLLPGMTLSAEIVVGKRSVMSYLLWPLTKAMSESFSKQVAYVYGLKMAERLTGKRKGDAVAKVLGHIENSDRGLFQSGAWVAIRQAIERNPAPFLTAYGIEMENKLSANLKTMAQIFTSAGKGAKRETLYLPKRNPLGIASQLCKPLQANTIGIQNKGEKNQSLSCVGIAHFPNSIEPSYAHQPESICVRETELDPVLCDPATGELLQFQLEPIQQQKEQ
jgi:hypothetical protein